MPAHRIISYRQLELLVQLMEQHKDKANVPIQKNPHFWEIVALRLNNCVGGTIRKPKAWQTYWTELKYKARNRAKKLKQGTSVRPLTAIQERIFNIIRLEACQELPEVQIPVQLPSNAPSSSSQDSHAPASPLSDYDHLEDRSHKNEVLESDNSDINDSETIEQQVFQKDTPRNEVTNHTVFLNEIIPTENVKSYEIQIPQKSKSDSIEDNPRKMFLLSLLPDIESFTQEEMRSFRRGVICTIDNIMDRRSNE